MPLSLEYVPIAQLKPARKNPKSHDLGEIHRSFERHGYVEPITVDDRTGRLVAGHGRVETLKQIKAKGGTPPDGIRLDKSGEWLVPVVKGWSSGSDDQADAYLLASNRLTVLGGWNDHDLAALLKELALSGNLEGTGFDGDDLDEMVKAEAPAIEAVAREPKKCPQCGFEVG